MSTRTETYRRKLLQAFETTHPYPIDLEWMVEIFKYKHISSLTTHLKRHFREKKEYLKRSEGNNKKAWRYYISVECFRRICYFCRHSERKVVAKYWLRKLAARDKLLYETSRRAEKAIHVRGVVNTPNTNEVVVDLAEDTAEETDEDEYSDDSSSSSTGSESSGDDYSDSEQDEDYHPLTLLDKDLQLDRLNTAYHLHQQTHSNNTGVLPQILHPFNFFFHDWSYLKLCPINHYLLSFYYSLPNHYSHAPDKSNIVNSNHPPAQVVAENSTLSNEEEFTSELDTSFDTNAFLTFPDEQQLPPHL